MDERILTASIALFLSPFLLAIVTRSPYALVGMPISFVYWGASGIVRRQLNGRFGVLTERKAIVVGSISIAVGVIFGVALFTVLARDAAG